MKKKVYTKKMVIIHFFCAFLLSFLVNNAKAQYIPFGSGGYVFKGLATDTIYIPTGCGTPAYTPNSYNRGALFYDTCNKVLKRFDPKLNTWGYVGIDTVTKVNDSTLRIFQSYAGNISFDIEINGNGAGGGSLIDTSNIVLRIDSLAAKIYVDTIYTHNGQGTDSIQYNKDGITRTAALIDHADGLIQPGYVTVSSGLTLDVTAAIYRINGTRYTSDAGQVTLPTADPDDPRYDVVAVDINGDIVSITGTPGTNPTIPQIDPATQVYLTAIQVPAGATDLLSAMIVYDENAEAYSGTAVGVAVDFDNATNVQHGSKSANVGAPGWVNGNQINFTKNSGTSLSTDYSVLKFFVKLKSALASTANIRVSFLNGTTVVSNVVTVGTQYGLTKSNTSSYQNISIPISAFTFSNTTFNKIRFTLAGTGGGMYLDYVQLQGGIETVTQETDPIATVKTVTLNAGLGLLMTQVPTQKIGDNPSYNLAIDTAYLDSLYLCPVPNIPNYYQNGYGEYVAFNTDSIAEGSTNLYWKQDALDDTAAAIRADFPSGSSAINNANIGSGFRLLKPATQEIKTLFNSYGLNWDSTSNTNGLTPNIDSFAYTTRAWDQKGKDSIGVILGTKISSIYAPLVKSNDTILIRENALAWGAKNDGDADHYDGAGTSATAIFSSATGHFSALTDIGKIIKIFGAGTSGRDLVTTIASVTSATQIVLATNLLTTITGKQYIYGTDNTTAIQNAILYIASVKGHKLFFPDGIYIVGGALRTSVGGINYNSQIYFPAALANATPVQKYHAVLEGETPPVYSQAANQNNASAVLGWGGTIIYSTLTTGATGAAIFGTKGDGTQTYDFAYGYVSVKNIAFRVQNNPAGAGAVIGGFSQKYGAAPQLDNLMADTDIPSYYQVTPTNDVAGFELPDGYAEGTTQMNVVVAQRFRKGIIIGGDHTSGDQVQAYNCVYGLYVKTGVKEGHISRAVTHACAYDVYFRGGANAFGRDKMFLIIDALSIETDTVTGHWQKHVYTISDSANKAYGHIDNIGIGEGDDIAASTRAIFTIIGGDSLNYDLTPVRKPTLTRNNAWQATSANTFAGSTTMNGSLTTNGTVKFNLGSDAAYDIYYRAPTTGLLTRLPLGGDSTFLGSVGGVLAWVVPTAGGTGGITSINSQAGSAQTLTGGTGIGIASGSNIHTFTNLLLTTGIAGGSTISSGANASDNTTLTSTFNATKSRIYLGSAQTSYIDELNKNVVLTGGVIGTTNVTGLSLTSSETASNGTQKFSPVFSITGVGWGTTLGTSQQTGWALNITPVQGTTASPELDFRPIINGAIGSAIITITTQGGSSGTINTFSGGVTTSSSSLTNSGVNANAINRFSGNTITINASAQTAQFNGTSNINNTTPAGIEIQRGGTYTGHNIFEVNRNLSAAPNGVFTNGASTFTYTNALEFFKPGDVLSINSNNYTITSISGTTVTYTPAYSSSTGSATITTVNSGGIVPNVSTSDNGIVRVNTGSWTGNGANLQIGAGNAYIAPLNIASGTLQTNNMTAGNLEFLTDKWYGTITTGTARKEFALFDAAGTSGRIPFETTNGRLTDDATLTYSTGTGLTTTKLVVAGSVAPDGGGLKHARITTGSVGAGSTALVTITWGTAFADANYTVSASVLDATTSSLSLSVVHIESITASAVTVRVLNNAIGSLTGTIDVIAMHD